MPILFGFKGKEKSLELKLSERQLGILLGLAAHNRHFEFDLPFSNVVLHPHGWIEIQNYKLQKELIELVQLFKQTPFCIENQKDKFFRFSIEPSIIYFEDKCFIYSVSSEDLKSIKSKIEITLTRLPIRTAFGITHEVKEVFNISINLASGLQELSQQQSPSDNPRAEKIEDNYSKTLPKEARFLLLGLKNVVRRENGIIKFCINYYENKSV